MLGFLLISTKNRVLLLDGDEQFKNYLVQKVEIEIRQPMELVSTSSGIVTDLMESVVPVRKRSKRLTSVRFSLDEISHLMLPIISMYRGSVALGDPIENISTGENSVTFKNLSNGCLILLIARSSDSSSLIDDFQRNLAINLGPLIVVLENDYISLKAAREHVSMNITKLIKGGKVFHDAVDMKTTVFHRNVVLKLFPLVKSICTQLQLFLGSNRCLLLCDKNVLLSTHSSGTDKPLSRYLNIRDLRGLIEQNASQPGELRKTEITQLWIRSKSSQVPFLVNVIRYKMTNNLTLVCLHQTKADRFIRLVVLIIMQLDQIQLGADIERIVKDLTESVNELAVHLQEFVAASKDVDSPFLRNPVRSSQYFKGHWAKISADLIKVSSTSQVVSKPNNHLSMASLKSAFSSFTLVASTLSLRNNNGKMIQELPLKTDVQLSQWRRQMVSLLHELFNLAKKDSATYKMTLFQNSIKTIIKPHHEKIISECSMKIAQTTDKLLKFMRPIDNKMDMLGYSLKETDKNLEVSYDTDEIKCFLPEWRTLAPSRNFCIDVEIDCGRRFSIYQLSGHKSVTKMGSLKALLGSSNQDVFIPSDLSVMAIFESYVNKELALKQIQTLVRLLRNHMTDSSIYFF